MSTGVAFLPNLESGSWLVMIRGAFGRQWLQRGSVNLRGDLGSGLYIYGLGTRPCYCDLGVGLHTKFLFFTN